MADNARTIVLIDDEYLAMRHYIQALERAHYVVVVLKNTDAALDYFQHSRPEVCCVILDIIMPPGEAFEDEDTNEGLRTGVLLYSRLIQDSLLLSMEIGEALLDDPSGLIPVAVLTNVTNSQTLQELERAHRENAPTQGLKIWAKLDVSPRKFASELTYWLGDAPDGGEEGQP